MADFTPGPWSFIFNGWHTTLVETEDGELIAEVSQFGDSSEANTKLIAAAPDMYEALEYACSELCHPECNKKTCSSCKIQHTIIKAEGREE